MNKKILTLILAAVMVLAGCGNENTEKTEQSESGSVNEQNVEASVKKDYDFSEAYKKIENSAEAVYEPVAEAKCGKVLSMDIPEGYTEGAFADSENTRQFYIVKNDNNTMYSTGRFFTAPADLAAYYGTTDKEKILDEMKSKYYPVMDVHDGLLKNSTIDFGYRLISDWTGKFGADGEYFLIEFQDDETNTHSIRFMAGNSKMDETYWIYEFRADVPIDDQQLIDNHRAMLFSLKEAE